MTADHVIDATTHKNNTRTNGRPAKACRQHLMVMYETLAGVMGPKSVLKIECRLCGHGAVWSRRMAMRRLDPGGSPYDIRRRLRCGACGGKQLRAWVEP